MADRLELVVTANHIKDVTSKLAVKLHEVVASTVKNIEAGAKAEAPVRTGFLRNSIGSEMTGELEGRAHVDAEYGPFVNFGTRHMAPRPFFTSTVERERETFRTRILEAGRTL